MERPSPRSTSSTRLASRRISGPMPSPARSAIFMRFSLPLGGGPGRESSREDPGFGLLPLLLVRLDLLRVPQREPDLIPAVQQTVLAGRIDVEGERLAARRRHRLPGEVDGELVALRRSLLGEEPRD